MSSNIKPNAPERQVLADHLPMPLLKVIRAKCLNCCCDQPAEVRRCAITGCPLWPYRMGRNPFAKPRGLSRPGPKGSQKNSAQIARNFGGSAPCSGDEHLGART